MDPLALLLRVLKIKCELEVHVISCSCCQGEMTLPTSQISWPQWIVPFPWLWPLKSCWWIRCYPPRWEHCGPCQQPVKSPRSWLVPWRQSPWWGCIHVFFHTSAVAQAGGSGVCSGKNLRDESASIKHILLGLLEDRSRSAFRVAYDDLLHRLICSDAKDRQKGEHDGADEDEELHIGAICGFASSAVVSVVWIFRGVM